jgi:hypothetical protein
MTGPEALRFIASKLRALAQVYGASLAIGALERDRETGKFTLALSLQIDGEAARALAMEVDEG